MIYFRAIFPHIFFTDTGKCHLRADSSPTAFVTKVKIKPLQIQSSKFRKHHVTSRNLKQGKLARAITFIFKITHEKLAEQLLSFSK